MKQSEIDSAFTLDWQTYRLLDDLARVSTARPFVQNRVALRNALLEKYAAASIMLASVSGDQNATRQIELAWDELSAADKKAAPTACRKLAQDVIRNRAKHLESLAAQQEADIAARERRIAGEQARLAREASEAEAQAARDKEGVQAARKQAAEILAKAEEDSNA